MVLVELLSQRMRKHLVRNWEGFRVKTSLIVWFSLQLWSLLFSEAVNICLCEALCMLSHDSLFYHYYGDVPFPSTFNHLSIWTYPQPSKDINKSGKFSR